MKECWQIVFISYAVLVVLYTWPAVISEFRVVKTVCHSCYSVLSLHGEPLCTLSKILLWDFRQHVIHMPACSMLTWIVKAEESKVNQFVRVKEVGKKSEKVNLLF
jgi:hypothetical protein